MLWSPTSYALTMGAMIATSHGHANFAGLGRAYRAITVLQQGCDNVVLPAELPSCQLIMAVASACKFLP
jgi:hypothetical protein